MQSQSVSHPAAWLDAAEFARFRGLLLERPDWQEQLGAIVTPDEFALAAGALARQEGLTLRPTTVLAAIRAHPFAIAGFLPVPDDTPNGLTHGEWPPSYWLPAHSAPAARSPTDGAPAFDWIWVGRERFVAPFHRDTIRALAFRPLAQMTRIRTDLAAMIEGAGHERTIAPTGFIFHMSRCGSTLAAQMLAAVPGHIVMSEPEPVDAVVQWAATSGASFARQVAALRAVVAALGRDRERGATRYFMKLDAWHGFALRLFRAAFPDTPWIFLHRDPAEVMVSLKAEPGIQSAPGGLPADLIGFDPAAAASLEDYAGRLFASLFDRVLAMLPEGGLAIDYRDLIPAMTTTIAAHFGFAPSDEEVAAMRKITLGDAKAPDQIFVSDTAAKRAAISPAIRVSVANHLATRYATLRRMSHRAK